MTRRHPSPGCATASAGTIPAYRLKLHYLASFCATFTSFYVTARNRVTLKFGLVKPFVSIGNTVTLVTLTFPHACERKKVLFFLLPQSDTFFIFPIYMCEFLCYHVTDPRNPNSDRGFRGNIANVTECYRMLPSGERKPRIVILWDLDKLIF